MRVTTSTRHRAAERGVEVAATVDLKAALRRPENHYSTGRQVVSISIKRRQYLAGKRSVAVDSLIAGWDFSTGAVKCVVFDLNGKVVTEARLPTELVGDNGVRELSLIQLEGQARQSVRAIAARLGADVRHWIAGGISATHHTAGRVDAVGNQVRRMIAWNDQTLGRYHAEGLARLGGAKVVQELIGGPWAVRYSLSHLVKDEHTLDAAHWQRTAKMLTHGTAAAGYLTGRFDCTSISSASSTGIMDLRTNQWSREMLGALADPRHREQAWKSLPTIIDTDEPIGTLAEHVAMAANLPAGVRPLVYPTLDDQAAGLLGGGAVDAGQVAIILGNSAVVSSSANSAPKSGSLDAMKLNWGPYLWMRCYTNGAQFLDHVVGDKPNWAALEMAARMVPAGCNGVTVLPFLFSEPSIGLTVPKYQWIPQEPRDAGVRLRASFEGLAYLIGLAVREHEAAGQVITRVTVSGGIANNDLMLEILASVLNRELVRLVSSEGTALGAAVSALAGYQGCAVGEAVEALVKFRPTKMRPRAEWLSVYANGLDAFNASLGA